MSGHLSYGKSWPPYGAYYRRYKKRWMLHKMILVKRPAVTLYGVHAALAEAQATGSKMYFWFVSSAPWKPGDKLMLRIR